MKCFRLAFLIFFLLMLSVNCVFAEDDIADRVESDYLNLIDQHEAKMILEYGVSTETESLFVRRAVKNYIIADLVDYTLLIFMAKYNVATGGIEMKKANAEILKSLRDLSDSANTQMIENINALREIKNLPPIDDLDE